MGADNGMNLFTIIIAAFIISLIIAVIIVGGWKRAMNTRVLQEAANAYLEQESFQVIQKSDRFLYHTVNRTRKEPQNTKKK